MLSYKIDHSDPTKDISIGIHHNENDDPVDFPFQLDHAKDASAGEIRADILTYLGTQDRTEYDPDQKFDPSILHDSVVIKDSVDGTTAWKITVNKSGEISTTNVTKT